MPEYGTCECFACYRRVPKPEAHRITIERAKGHTGGSFRFSRRSTSYSTGRTYYAKQDVWLCNDCYPAYRARRSQQSLNGVIGFGAFLVICAVVGSMSPKQSSSGTKQITAETLASTQTASLVHTEEAISQPAPTTAPSILSVPSSNEISSAQNRLIELGYLLGPADGLWGPRSRQALLAFKISTVLRQMTSGMALLTRRGFHQMPFAAPCRLSVVKHHRSCQSPDQTLKVGNDHRAPTRPMADARQRAILKPIWHTLAACVWEEQ